jgi:hypothetical protein
MTTLQTLLARALVRLAIWTAPADKAGPLEAATRPIWRPGAQ